MKGEWYYRQEQWFAPKGLLHSLADRYSLGNGPACINGVERRIATGVTRFRVKIEKGGPWSISQSSRSASGPRGCVFLHRAGVKHLEDLLKEWGEFKVTVEYQLEGEKRTRTKVIK